MSNVIADTRPAACRAVQPQPQPTFEGLATRDAEVGGIAIRRALPRRERRLVGAWCFLDHFGPHAIGHGPGLRVGPHPHIGLQTVTWLYEGEILHRDSLGSQRVIHPGELNLMTAGCGIAHSEETPAKHGDGMHGLQFWLALPDSERHREPEFAHFPSLPVLGDRGLVVTVIVGEAQGERSPARTYSPLVGLDLDVRDAGRRALALNPGFEHALLVVAGEFEIGHRRLDPTALYYLGAGRSRLEFTNEAPARAFLFGGKPFGEEVLLWWNFVARSTAEMAAALKDWEHHSSRFGEVTDYDGERLVAPPLAAGLGSSAG